MKIQLSNPAQGSRCAETTVDELFFFFLDSDWLEIFSFKDLAAIETFDIINPVAAGQDHRAFMLAEGLHTKQIGSF